MLKLGILDIGLVDDNFNSYGVLERTISNAQLADELGFSRYWLGEHYEHPFAWRNPDVLISVLASVTTNIRIGAAGILFSLHPVLRVAENYRLLSGLFPNRIDLGIASGHTAIETIRELINESDYIYNIQNHEARIAKLKSYLHSGFYNEGKGIIPPNIIPELEVWSLGTGGIGGTTIANNIKLNYSLSLFHTGFDENKIESIRLFRDKFSQKHGILPNVNICCSVLLSDKFSDMNSLQNSCIGKHMTINISGNISLIKEKLLNFADMFEAEELIIVDVCNDSQKKTELIEALGNEFNLNQQI
jgi:luciferase family oxidoreductase group 1